MNYVKPILTAGVLAATLASAHAAVIATWTFETAPPADLSNSTAIGSISADVGSGTASGVHASAATDWTTPSGNGSANSLSSNEWAVGDYYQFSVATTGLQDITISWAQVSSSTGPGEFKLAYQVNGGGFTDHLNYTVLPNSATAPGVGTWNGTTEITGYNYSVDLSAVTALDSAASVDFRLIMRTTADAAPPGTVATTGTDRVDNFSVSGTFAPVPEPETYALIAGVGLAGFALWRRLRR